MSLQFGIWTELWLTHIECFTLYKVFDFDQIVLSSFALCDVLMAFFILLQDCTLLSDEQQTL